MTMRLAQAAKDIRTALTAAFELLPTGWQIEWDNRFTADNTLQKPTVCVEILYNAATQASLGYTAVMRRTGVVGLLFKVPLGQGTAKVAEAVDLIGGALERRRIGLVQLTEASPGRSDDAHGAYVQPLQFVFWWDDLSTV